MLFKSLHTTTVTSILYVSLFISVFSLFTSSNIQAQGSSFRTETQTTWGTVPHGNNAATYMSRKFHAAFPNGLEVGCTNKLVFSNPSALTDFLPSDGSAAVLPSGTTINPSMANRNILVGHIVALKLNIAFDANDAHFSSSPILLKDLIVKTGIFAEKTVQTVLQEAENVVGGCSSAYQLSDLTMAVAKINENYNNGTDDMGFLKSNSVGCINDNEPPVFKEMPKIFTVFADGCYVASWNVPVVTDNCSNVTLTSNINLGDCLPVGTHHVVMTAKDASGNTSTYSFNITIEEAIYVSPLNSIQNKVALIAHSTKKSVDLDWGNKNNENTSYFIVQKANDTENFEDVEGINARSMSGYQNYT